MEGLMQDWPLTINRILDHASEWHGAVDIVSRAHNNAIERTTYRDIHQRAKKVSGALLKLGVAPGDRVATLAWNNAYHLESWYGIMGIGAICHTLNPRLFIDDLRFIINHARDKVIITDVEFLPILAEIRDQLPSVEHVIVLATSKNMPSIGIPGMICMEELLEEHSPDCEWGKFSENTASSLCYTSGTTGAPKGVLYSHRSNFLHSWATISPDVMNLSSTDVVMPIVPMFHANAWGLAFSCPAVGAKLVMPGGKLDAASIYELLEQESVTFTAAVPTIFQMLLSYLRETGKRLSTLQRVVIGGSAVPETIVRGFRDEYGIEVTHAWGMTEMSPLGTLSSPNRRLKNSAASAWAPYALKQGRAPLGVEMMVVDDTGQPLPHDGVSNGNLMVRGAWVARQYFRDKEVGMLSPSGYFDTGDIATIDADGFMQITDRAKDVIKSGGEWISSIELENIAASHPKAALTAVVGVSHPKWDERPVLIVKLANGVTSSPREFLDFLGDRVAKWWVPDDVLFMNDIPLGPTGKVDKKALRTLIQN